MKRVSLLRDKSFKELKLWNYRTLIMLLVISVIIFLLLLLVSGCKLNSAENTSKKQLIKQSTLKITAVEPEINIENFISEANIEIICLDNKSSEFFSSLSIRESQDNLLKGSVIIQANSI